ncbi:hypothetical protein JDV02_007095 [Purpureocillium takamizusanense]|uniref:J domain-containing protein n=1 Tax=Purpureocillium takamizusanense TaxID=2060973 RepID=A0A9Q8QLS1_9HYPO|nr:uncharacterized protein JDV02_007095 [Purpureocillium takamizusanense]UNI21074.1 hypothetical protein JDV02_007095 [Purpureocillium takamizusanense]
MRSSAMRAALRPEMQRAVAARLMSTSRTAMTATTMAKATTGSSSSSGSSSSNSNGPRRRRDAHGLVGTPSIRRALFSHSASVSSPSSSAAEVTEPPSAASTAQPSQEPDTLYGYFPSTLPDGPPPRGHFPIDTALLRREFLRLQAAHHPDKHPSGPAKALAERSSAAINHAYRTLADPLLRAQYLLALRGVDVAHDEALRADDQPALLAAVMDAHEAIEDAVRPQDLDPLRGDNDRRVARSVRLLEDAFRRDDVDAAKREAVRLRYWINIRDSIHNWEEGRPVVLQH